MFQKLELPSTKTVVSTAASAAATSMLLRSIAKDFIPPELRQYLYTKFQILFSTFTNEITLTIDEYEGLNKNQLFYASEIYLNTIINPSTKRFRASIREKGKRINFSVSGNEDIIDRFCGFQLKWRMVNQQTKPRSVRYPDEYNSTTITDYKFLELTFHKKYKDRVFEEYLPYVLEKSRVVKEGKKTLKLHTLKNERMHGPSRSPWQSVNLDHPSTFETLAMDDGIKTKIIDDLDMFLKRREFYRKVGKAWKRGYLLFGPPGTGKSSLIAAMANYLNFDVYDLELTDLRCNSDLRRLLISTANRSILVVEDIDASIDLSERKTSAPIPMSMMRHPYQDNQEPKVTLSGLLNFTDGLWSSCGDERIVIFTTNHINKLDPALLRPGRMDVHIHMSYCTPCGFKMLVSNYLTTTDNINPLVFEAEQLIGSTEVTPAEVGEQLLKCDDSERALQGLIEFLKEKKESERVEIKKLEVANSEEVEKNENEIEIGLKGLIKMSKASPKEVKELVLKNHEARDALKILMGFLGENGNEDHKEFDASLESSLVIVADSREKVETKTE